MNHRLPQTILGAALLAAALVGAAFYLLRRPHVDPARLLAALDAFTGEWAGDASIQSSDGKPLETLRMTRRYSWIGEKQIVETRFTDGAEAFSTRAIQWVEDGSLKAVGTGPDAESSEFSGAPTPDGILWTNQHHAKADRLDRIVTQGGQTTVQSASINQLHLGRISGVVGVAAVLLPHTEAEVSTLAATAAAADSAARIAELERKLADAEQERERLRARLDLMRSAPADSDETRNAKKETGAPSGGAPLHPSQVEVRSSPPGMSFEIRAEDAENLISSTARWSGTTPMTLTDVPPGNYAVILQREGQRKTVHHITVNENADVFLFHREEGAAMRAPIIAPIETPPPPALP